MSTPTDLAGLLAAGERAVFHGKPADAVSSLESAAAVARDQGRQAEVTASAWLLGVALGASGRYGAALAVLEPLARDAGVDSPAEQQLFGSLAGSTMASIHRQLGRHAAAHQADTAALALTEGRGEAAFDARLGLAADAVGLADLPAARRELDAATALIPARAGEWWRQSVRLDWVRAEVALLAGTPEEAEEAVEAATAAISRAEAARAPRHVAKGLLFLGVAQLKAGDEEAITTLRRAATLAEGLGTVGLVWPARALLGALLTEADPNESSRCLSLARTAVLSIAEDLPEPLRAQWLAREDVAALLAQ